MTDKCATDNNINTLPHQDTWTERSPGTHSYEVRTVHALV